MERLTKFFIDRPMLIHVIVIALVVFGLRSMFDARKEGFPEISLNQVVIKTFYPGASAHDIELNVTIPIEEKLEEVEGIQEILSTSQEGSSIITIKANENANDQEFQRLYRDIDAALNSVSGLPIDLEQQPVIDDITSSDIPVMEIAFTGEYEILKPYIDRLEKKLKRIAGVGDVLVVGLPDQEVEISVDPKKALYYDFDLRSIANAIRKRNLEGSGGTLESVVDEKKIVFLSKFESYQDVLNVNLRRNDIGYGVKLKDIATVKLVPKETNLLIRNNGKRGGNIFIKKTASADLLDTIDSINKLLKNEKPPTGITIKTVFDFSNVTRNRIKLLASNAALGFLLVISILLFIFNIKTAVWTAFGIPFTLLGVFIFLYTQGISLNVISLGGFIIIIGMLVDDAIVIAEEINKNRELGMKAKTAAVEAVKKIWKPVATSALTTMAAFSPMFFLGGFPGKFIWTIPLIVIIGLTVSLIESYLILPAHLSHGKNKEVKKGKFVEQMEHLYQAVIRWVLRFRVFVFLFFFVLLGASLFYMKNFAKVEPFPQDSSEGFSVSITLPKGSTVQETEQEVIKVEQFLQQLPKNEMLGYSSHIGTQSLSASTEMGTQNNFAVIFVYLTPLDQRNRVATKIIKILEKQIAENLDISKNTYVVNLKRMGPPMGRAFDIRVISNDDVARKEKEKQIRKYLATISGVYDIETDDVAGKQELNLKIDYDTLAQTGLTVEDILSTLRIAFSGTIVTNLVTVDKTLDFRLRLDKEKHLDKNLIEQLPIANPQGRLIRLSVFSKLVEQPSRSAIHHVNGIRSVSIFGNTNSDIISPQEVMDAVAAKFPSNNKVDIEYAGQPVETKKIIGGLAFAGVVAVLAIYLLIAVMFNSFSKPLIIMSSLPFLLIGLVFVLMTHGIVMSMFAGVGMIGLMGVVVNNSIVMVHTIQELAAKDNLPVTRKHIIVGSSMRLRPVLLTTITTALGVFPTAYGIGGSDPFISNLALVLAYGLIFGTTITLIIVPSIFSVALDIKKIKERVSTKFFADKK